MSAAPASIEERLDTLRRAFETRLRAEVGELSELLNVIRTEPGAEAIERIRVLAHRLIGAAGLFGMSDLTEPAIAVETAIIEDRPSGEIGIKTAALIDRITDNLDTTRT